MRWRRCLITAKRKLKREFARPSTVRMRAIKINVGIFAMSCVGCQFGSLQSEIVGFPRVVSSREDVLFKLRLRNRSLISQPIPTEFEVRYCAAFAFVPGADPKNRDIGFEFTTPRGIDLCPPSCEVIGAWKTREYEFRWSPPKNAHGEGALVVQLQEELPKIAPLAVRME